MVMRLGTSERRPTGLAVWTVGTVWASAALVGWIRPRRTGLLIGAAAAMLGPITVPDDRYGSILVIGLATAGLLIAGSIPAHETALLGGSPDEPPPRRRRAGREQRLRDLEERQAELQEEPARIAESIEQLRDEGWRARTPSPARTSGTSPSTRPCSSCVSVLLLVTTLAE